MDPAIVRTAPRTLIDSLVTNPANSSVTPNASTRGQAVGAGNCRVPGSSVLVVAELGIMSLTSASDHVDHQENYDPYGVYKMPVQRQSIHALGMVSLHLSKHREQPYCAKAKQAHDHVESMQSN